MVQEYVDLQGSKAFVLVHGAGSGAWIWHKLMPLLERIGHQAFAVDWEYGKGCAPDASLAEILLRQKRPAILVGHGAGGMRLLGAMGTLPPVQAVVLIAATDQGALSMPEGRKKAAACSEADYLWMESLMSKAEAPDGTVSGAYLAAGTKREAPLYYVYCPKDAVVLPEAQRAFCRRFRPDMVFELEADHFPQVSRAEELAYLLHRVSLAGGVASPSSHFSR